jgi:hypothetical protein
LQTADTCILYDRYERTVHDCDCWYVLTLWLMAFFVMIL